jgi:aerobic carbon-monoxide dehydrogenase medium subunit
MISATFEYTKATSVEQAIAALADGDAKILAGGHSLLPAMKLRLNMAGKLVDISKLEALKGVRMEDGEIVIGAGTTHAAISSNSIVKEHLSFFAEGAHHIGDVQVRNHGTIGGSLAHADPSADWPALVLAAGATIEVQGASGKRRITADDFFVGLFTTALAEDEIITAIRVPVPASGSKSTYLKFVQPASRFAIVGCAVMKLAGGGIRIAFSGVSDTPFRDAAAEAAYNKAGIDDACNAAAENVTIMGDHYASEHYRKHLAKVYLRKALEEVG